MEQRNQYWLLDCILALTAIALGAAALCSFAGVAIPPQSGTALSIEALVCVAAVVVGALFAGFVWRDQRQPGRRHAVRAHQERHAIMMTRESQRLAPAMAPQPTAEPAEAKGTPETLLVTSITDVKTERRVQRRQQARRAAETAISAAA